MGRVPRSWALWAVAAAFAPSCKGSINNGNSFLLTITTRASVNSQGQEAQGSSSELSLSGDGRFLAFKSFATNLAPGTLGFGDIFVRDLLLGTTELVSIDGAGAGGNGESSAPSISADGRYVAFHSAATNLVVGVDNNGVDDVFLRDRQAGVTVRVSGSGVVPLGNGHSRYPSVSASGRWVAFQSEATNLDGVLDTNNVADIFVRDMLTGDIARASLNTLGDPPDGGSFQPSISADGQHVAFHSFATDIVSNDTNGVADVFVIDRATGRSERISVDPSRLDGNGASIRASISGDGRYVAFQSDATNLTSVFDNNNATDVFVRDRQTQTTTLVSIHSSGALGAGASAAAAISADGRMIVFKSDAPNLVDDDTNTVGDVFLRDTLLGRTTRISVRTYGVQASDASPSIDPTISADGRYAAFLSAAQDMVDGDTNGAQDAYVRGPLF